jgi:hypothetical protein
MPIRQFVWIDGEFVSPWVMNIDTDIVIPAMSQENFCQQADITLSNVNGRFDGAFGGLIYGPQSSIIIVLNSIEYPGPEVYSALVFTGLCQNVDYGYRSVKIHAGTGDSNANAYLKFPVHSHEGSDGEDVLFEVMGQDNLKDGIIVIPKQVKKREWGFLKDQSRKGVLDYVAEWHGCEGFMDEHNQYNHIPPVVIGDNPPYTGRMKEPMASESAIAFCNRVRVTSNAFLSADTPGSEHNSNKVVAYQTTDADLIMLLNNEEGEGGAEELARMKESYGIIDAPDVVVPELSTQEECRIRALKLLARYITYFKRTLPSVVGRTPRLSTRISYQYPRLINHAWQLSGMFSGRAVRAKTNFSPKTGWVCYIEVEPYVIPTAAQAEIYGEMDLRQ